MVSKPALHHRAPRMLAAIFLCFLLSACAGVRLVSDYDEPTDKALTALQQTSDDFIARLIADAPSENNSFDRQKQFYDEADQQLRRLEFRVNSIPKNGKTTALVDDIRASLLGDGKCSAEGRSLRDLHCNPEGLAKGPSRVALQIARRNINQTMIVEASATGEISRTEAKILVNMQKVAASAVLTAAEGMTAVAVQAALDAALNVAKDFVNGKIGFALL